MTNGKNHQEHEIRYKEWLEVADTKDDHLYHETEVIIDSEKRAKLDKGKNHNHEFEFWIKLKSKVVQASWFVFVFYLILQGDA